MDDDGKLSASEQALEEAKQALDALPPEEVRRLFMEQRGIEAAIGALTELADSDARSAKMPVPRLSALGLADPEVC